MYGTAATITAHQSLRQQMILLEQSCATMTGAACVWA